MRKRIKIVNGIKYQLMRYIPRKAMIEYIDEFWQYTPYAVKKQIDNIILSNIYLSDDTLIEMVLKLHNFTETGQPLGMTYYQICELIKHDILIIER